MSNKKLIEFRGTKDTLSGWARRLGISRQTLWHRLNQGMPLEDALSRGLKPHTYRGKLIRWHGRDYNITELLQRRGLSNHRYYYMRRKNPDMTPLALMDKMINEHH